MKIKSIRSLGRQRTCDVINSRMKNFILKGGIGIGVVSHNSALGYNLYS